MNPTPNPPIGDWMTPELEADTRAVIEKLMTGKPLDPETEARIRAEASGGTFQSRLNRPSATMLSRPPLKRT